MLYLSHKLINIMAQRIPKEKANLVIIHSFPTNSIILKGFYDFLSDFFNVYPIDLPGFLKSIKPLKTINFANYAHYVEREIKKLNLESYWVGGVSFGFAVVNLIKDHKNCRGVFAIEPYLGSENLNIPLYKRLLFLFIIRILGALNVFYKVWHSPSIQKYLLFGSSARLDEKIKSLLDEMDARTFFQTAKLLLHNHQVNCVFLKRPYVLVINKEDGSIRADRIISRFANQVEDLVIVHTSAEHYPKTITREYFKKRIKKEEIAKILDFVDKFQ
jgi:pimeloyl-ACP methyl ester carboxylesterase